MKKLAFSMAVSLALSGCAETYKPIVDMKGVDDAKYTTDLRQCREYAFQVDPGVQALFGALGGAALGAGLAQGIDSSFASDMAVSGAIGGSMAGAAHGAYSQTVVINDCLKGRGYKVLGGA